LKKKITKKIKNKTNSNKKKIRTSKDTKKLMKRHVHLLAKRRVRKKFIEA
jgi:hypothetical protein